jgi:hypothetical protein
VHGVKILLPWPVPYLLNRALLILKYGAHRLELANGDILTPHVRTQELGPRQLPYNTTSPAEAGRGFTHVCESDIYTLSPIMLSMLCSSILDYG